MMIPRVTAHMIVKNEEQWIWYAINSVLPFVERIIIYDTGSVDKTVEHIAIINSPKICLVKKGIVDAKELVNLRNLQIKETETPWFMLLDGDEVWTEASLQSVFTALTSLDNQVIGVFTRVKIPVGDLFHLQEERAGRYSLGGRVGHYNMRFYRKKKNFHWMGTYPLEAYVDEYGKAINDQKDKIYFADAFYWHLTHLLRSSKDDHRKFKREVGTPTSKRELPQVFFQERPASIPSPWVDFSPLDFALAKVLTPLRKLKRRLA